MLFHFVDVQRNMFILLRLGSDCETASRSSCIHGWEYEVDHRRILLPRLMEVPTYVGGTEVGVHNK